MLFRATERKTKGRRMGDEQDVRKFFFHILLVTVGIVTTFCKNNYCQVILWQYVAKFSESLRPAITLLETYSNK